MKYSTRKTRLIGQRDEDYVIDLCDRVLSPLRAKRQYRFDFLRGDPGRSGRCARLPVDAFYEELKLVIEYGETQHYKPHKFFDRRATISNCGRGEQRRRYDKRRAEVLPRNGFRLIVIGYHLFQHGSNQRLIRDQAGDEAVISETLAEFLPIR